METVMVTEAVMIALSCGPPLALIPVTTVLVRRGNRQFRQWWERAEIFRAASDLNDDLLQEVHGLMLRLQVVHDALPGEAHARRYLDDILRSGDDLLGEGGERARVLRPSHESSPGLPEAFWLAAETSPRRPRARLTIIVEGKERPLKPIVREELCRIGLELLGREFGHADVHALEVDICHEERAFTLRFRRDNRRIPGSRPPHQTLTAERERATRTGGTLRVWSLARGGMEVEVRLPALAAYVRGDVAPLHWLRRTIGEGRPR
jgi:signal transduction histidine kinase